MAAKERDTKGLQDKLILCGREQCTIPTAPQVYEFSSLVLSIFFFWLVSTGFWHCIRSVNSSLLRPHRAKVVFLCYSLCKQTGWKFLTLNFEFLTWKTEGWQFPQQGTSSRSVLFALALLPNFTHITSSCSSIANIIFLFFSAK